MLEVTIDIRVRQADKIRLALEGLCLTWVQCAESKDYSRWASIHVESLATVQEKTLPRIIAVLWVSLLRSSGRLETEARNLALLVFKDSQSPRTDSSYPDSRG